jgi:hypothetical protein
VRSSPLAVALIATALFLAACSDQAPQLPTASARVGAPSRLYSSPSTACTRDDERTLRGGINDLFASSVRRRADDLRAALVTACGAGGTKAARVTAALNFAQEITGYSTGSPATDATGWWYAGSMTGTQDAVWQYLTLIFRYAGYTTDNVSRALASDGRVRVCDAQSDCLVKAMGNNAGVRTYAGALPANAGGDTRHLISLAPVSCGALEQSTNLKVWAQCVRISATPSDLSDFKFVVGSRGARVEVCPAYSVQGNVDVKYLVTPPTTSGEEPGRLGQKPNAPLRVRAGATGNLGLACGENVTQVATAGYMGFGERASRLAGAWFATAGRTAFEVLAPSAAGASHGGLGSMGGDLVDGFSDFGLVDPFVFQGTFDNDTPGTLPATPFRGRGSWTISRLTPGEIVVSAPQAPFASNFVVIDQRGGNADPKDGVKLLANFQAQGTRLATQGTYQISWKALVVSPRAGGVAFVVRDEQQLEIARVVFGDADAGQSGPITFNGQRVGTWQQNVLQAYALTVDLSTTTPTDRVRFTIGGTAAGTSTNYLSTVLAGRGATLVALTQAGWEADGVDARRLWTDEIVAVRLPDASSVVSP